MLGCPRTTIYCILLIVKPHAISTYRRHILYENISNSNYVRRWISGWGAQGTELLCCFLTYFLASPYYLFICWDNTMFIKKICIINSDIYCIRAYTSVTRHWHCSARYSGTFYLIFDYFFGFIPWRLPPNFVGDCF